MGRIADLPSGAKLEICETPFAVSHGLYKAFLAEGRELKLNPSAEIDTNFYKDLFCICMGSPRIEAALNECLKRTTYNGSKIDDKTFEPVTRRCDYQSVCLEVMLENLMPFLNDLSAQFAGIMNRLSDILASRSPKTP